MIVLLMALTFAQASRCEGSAAQVAAASERAAAFDLEAAAARLRVGPSDCAETDVPYWYLRGLIAAQEAYRDGGSPQSLEPVKAAIAALSARTTEAREAEIARVVLEAASAAAQSERDVMALLLDHALHLEGEQRSAGLPGAPIITAYEVAGDLWLQVHRFEDARMAYARAAREIGPTKRIFLGLARAASRLGETTAACEEYRRLVAGWRGAENEPPEIAEAHTFLRQPACLGPVPAPIR